MVSLAIGASTYLWYWAWSTRRPVARKYFSGFWGRDLALRGIPAWVFVLWFAPVTLAVGNLSDTAGLVCAGMLVVGLVGFWVAPLPAWWGPEWLRRP